MPQPRTHGAVPSSSKSVTGTLAILLALSIAACDRSSEQDVQRGGERPVPVTMQRLQLRPFSDTVRALGTVRARESVTVTAKVSETVERVHFESGDTVKAGAPLVTLSGQAQQASLREAQATADEAERLFRRQSELAGQQLIARSQLDTQRATRDAANARVAQIRAQLGDRTIRAPFSGVLGLRQVSPGSLVTPGTVIATLDDTARVYVDFPVPEMRLAEVQPGQQLSATSAAYPGRRFEGTVSTVDARIDPATRAVVVRGDFPNAGRALKPGMLMQVTLSRAERPALLVPEISVVQIGSDSFVYRVQPDGSAERVRVEIGARREGVAEIVKGLEVGDVVVVDGTGKLRPGSKVVEAEKTPAADGAEAAR